MARGKQTCKILKEIRRQIAEANGIEFATSECRYRGDCLGTCPKCEAEVRYLEQQLRARSLAGKAVALAGISAGMIAFSGCGGSSSNQSNVTLQGEPEATVEQIEMADTIDEGELPVIEDTAVIKKGEIDVSAFPVVGEVSEESYPLVDERPVFPGNESDSNSSKKVDGIKECAVVNDPNLVVTQGEMPDECPTMPDENKIYFAVEQLPEFPGGQTAMMKFICDNLKYPEEMINDFQGRVVVKFYIDTLGHVCAPEIVKGRDSALDREALRVVGLFPDFIPAQHLGKKVNAWFTLPISFKYSDYIDYCD